MTKKQSKQQKRKNRKQKKSLYLLKQKNKKTPPKAYKPWSQPKMSFYRIPSLPANIGQEERVGMWKKITDEATELFNRKYPLLQEWFLKYDQLYLLSYCSCYLMSRPQGVDPEAHGPLKFYSHYLEIQQAFALMQKRNYSPEPLHDNVNKFINEWKELGNAMSMKIMGMPETSIAQIDVHKQFLRNQVMMQTIAIRNWAYQWQMKRITGDLAKYVADKFTQIYNLDAAMFIEILFKMVDVAEEKLNAYKTKLRQFIFQKTYSNMFDAYHKAFPESQLITQKGKEELWKLTGNNLKKLSYMLICHADLQLEDIYTFNIEEIANIYGDVNKMEPLRNLFDGWSYEFGELKDFKKEHIIMDNPIHKKPFIKTDKECYYSAIVGLLPHLALGLLEDLICKDSDLEKIYRDKIKPTYLENEVERLFSAHMPNAHVYKGSMWRTSGKQQYDNDVLVILDNFAIVIECKSGAITKPARRGAPDRLAETLKKLIEEPSEQAHRFIAYLKENQRIHNFETKSGKINIVDNTKIEYYIPIGITLDEFGSISSNVKVLIDSGITNKKINELASSFCLTDLECILESLHFEAEKMHYFAERREFEREVQYHGDEMDILALYLENGFNTYRENASDNFFNASLKSKEIDPYFAAKGDGITLEKNHRTMTKWWNDLLEHIQNKKPKKWVEISYILLNVKHEDQKLFEERVNALKIIIRRGRAPKKHSYIELVTGPQHNEFVIVGYPYVTNDTDLRDSVTQEIMSRDRKETCNILCIGININRSHYPYSFIAFDGRLKVYKN